MKHLLSMLALICVTLTAITFYITACSDEAPDLGRSIKIDLSDGVSLEMVKVEAGTFEMSVMNGIESGFGEVAHQVTIARDFYIGRTEVTQAQYKAVIGYNPAAHFSLSNSVIGDDLPVVKVSWNKAMEFCEKLNAMGKAPKGWMFTLPTETQWEYAARGGKKSKGYKYSGSNNIDEVAWYGVNSGDSRLDDSSWDYEAIVAAENNNCRPHPVGQKKANELGLYDMSGNVYEFCLDDWQDKSDKLKAEFTCENDRGKSDHAMRGGAYCFPSNLSHPARRNRNFGNDDGDYKGFRIALVQMNRDNADAEKKAAQNNLASEGAITSAEEQYNLGLDSYEKQDYSEAVKYFKKAAEQGHASAQFNLGVCYKNGDGVEKDMKEAVKWFRKAADQGNEMAQFTVGLFYAAGVGGVTKNQVEAVKWFRKAADQGHVEAQNQLGNCYYNGEGVEKNTAEAVNWWREAAEQGHAEAQIRLGILFDAAGNRVEASKWIRKAADQGNEMAKEALKIFGY